MEPLATSAAPTLDEDHPSPREAESAAGANRRPFLIVGLVIAAGLASLVAYELRIRGQESTDDAQVESDVVTLSVRVPGLVIAVEAEDNRPIQKGELIARIDETDYAARLKQARSELAQARAQAAQAEAQERVVAASAKGGIAAAQASVAGSSYAERGAHANIASAQASVSYAESDARRAELDLARYQTLLRDSAVPQSKFDEVEAAAERARSTLAQARAALNAAEEQQHAADAHVAEARGHLTQSAPLETQLEVARANTALQRARVEAAEAALALAQSQMDATRVVAPADGLLTNLSLRAGVLAAVGTPVGLLVPRDVYVVANFKETQIGEMRRGQPAAVSIDAFAPRIFQGQVESIAGGTQGRFSLLPSDNAAENFVKVVQRVPVRVRLPATEAALLPGLSAQVTVSVR